MGEVVYSSHLKYKSIITLDLSILNLKKGIMEESKTPAANKLYKAERR
jgi:hypothetical protein